MAGRSLDGDFCFDISLSELNEVDVKSFTGHEDEVISIYGYIYIVIQRDYGFQQSLFVQNHQ